MWIKEQLRAEAIVTGDIDFVNGLPNWIEECCQKIGLAAHKPLWGKDRLWVMEEILSRGICARISWINHPGIPESWLHREINWSFLEGMKALAAKLGFDLTGENGEYHTMVSHPRISFLSASGSAST
jgi:diphthamide synthase (EF-2-diphthine--ammonia ligase)